MKPFVFVILSFAAISLAVYTLSSCKTPESISKEDLNLLLLLEKGKTAAYVQKKYVDFKPSSVRKANRTLNEYRANFSTTKKEEVDLLKKLEEDPIVLKVTISRRGGVDVQSSTNQKSSKVPPIKKN